jgi:hypothetical protein
MNPTPLAEGRAARLGLSINSNLASAYRDIQP